MRPDSPERLFERIRFHAQPEQRREALGDVIAPGREGQDPLPGNLGRQRIVEARSRPHHLRDRPEGNAVTVGQAAPAQRARAPVVGCKELIDEARFADARARNDGQEPGTPRFAGLALRRVESLQLLGPTNKRSLEPPPMRPRTHDLDEPVRLDLVGLALEFQGFDELDIDGVSDEVVGNLTDEHLARWRGLLEARGGVHGVAGDQALSGGRVAGNDLSGVHAGPVLERYPPSPAELRIDVHEAELHLPGGPDGANGIVFANSGKPEHRHDGVADELLDGSAVALDDRRASHRSRRRAPP